MENKLITNLVQQIANIQDQEIWLDENFKKKIDEISEDQAFFRPLPELHSVAELISHLLVWRKECILRINGKTGKLTMDSPENWKTNRELKTTGWNKLKADFYKSTEEIIKLIKNQPDQYLNNEYKKGYKFKYLIEGLIHHDLYHLGQIGITIKFLNK